MNLHNDFLNEWRSDAVMGDDGVPAMLGFTTSQAITAVIFDGQTPAAVGANAEVEQRLGQARLEIWPFDEIGGEIT